MTQITEPGDLLAEIEDARQRQDLSLRGLCAKAGVNRNALYNWKVNGHQPSLSTVLHLARALGLEIKLQ